MIIKLFSWGGVASRAEIVHIWPCLKPYYCQTTLMRNPNFSDASNFAKYNIAY